MYRLAMLMALVVAAFPALSASAQASPTVAVVQTWPGGDEVTLANGSNFYLRIGYTTDQPVSIWARPYFAGKEVAAGSNPSRSYSGSGEALGWFFLMHPGDQVDEVRILVGDGSSNGTSMLASRRVRITAGAASAAGTDDDAPEWVARMKRLDAAAQQADYFGVTMDEVTRGGAKARDYVQSVLASRVFSIHTRHASAQGRAKTIRYYGLVVVENRYLHEILLGEGLARNVGAKVALPTGEKSKEYAAALGVVEERARLQRRGLWASSDPAKRKPPL